MGKIVNKRELQEIIGTSHQSLWNWDREGMPVLTRGENGEANQYDTEAVIAWMVARATAKGERESEKDRLTKLQADEIEMRLAEKRRELINVTEIEPAWTAQVLATRQSLLTLPQRLAPQLVNAATADAIRALLEEAIEDSLTKLATSDDDSGTEGTAQARDAAVASAAADAAIAMG